MKYSSILLLTSIVWISNSTYASENLEHWVMNPQGVGYDTSHADDEITTAYDLKRGVYLVSVGSKEAKNCKNDSSQTLWLVDQTVVKFTHFCDIDLKGRSMVYYMPTYKQGSQLLMQKFKTQRDVVIAGRKYSTKDFEKIVSQIEDFSKRASIAF